MPIMKFDCYTECIYEWEWEWECVRVGWVCLWKSEQIMGETLFKKFEQYTNEQYVSITTIKWKWIFECFQQLFEQQQKYKYKPSEMKWKKNRRERQRERKNYPLLK